MIKKKLPIGLSDFKEIIKENYYYVDKSLLIKEIMDSSAKSTLIPRPRRFGKTLNLTMLRYFYEKTEEDTSALFKHLAIWQQGETYTRSQGGHPVIYLTFKDVKSSTWEKCEEQLKRVISNEYRRHKYLLENGRLDSFEEKEFMDIMALTASSVAYENSLTHLSAHLAEYYNKKTVILIDEYDTPIQGGYMSGYYPQIIEFMRNLLSGALKDNEYLEKGVLTGILRVAKESIFSGLNNLEVCSLLSNKYSHHFGLLEPEVEDMMKYYKIESESEEVKRWYNGYIFGEIVIYNPWSIINFTDKWQEGTRPYWVNTSSNDLVRQILTRSGRDVKEELETLIRGGSIRKIVDDNVVFGEVENSTDTIWSFLLFSGYLKAVSKKIDGKRLKCELRIPNLEVEYLYEEIILGWLNQAAYSDQYQAMLKGLTTGDIETFEYIFHEYVMKTFSVFDTGGEEPEKVYHAFVLGLLVSLQDSYEVKSNRESGFGRYDVMLIPKNVGGKGIIMEFKKANSVKKETLEEAVHQALQQIEQKNYEQELTERGITDILKLGIAFKGKEVAIKSV